LIGKHEERCGVFYASALSTQQQGDEGYTISILAQQSISILESGSFPSILREIIPQEFKHHILFLVSRRLTPKTMHHFLLAERKEYEGT
jgi:hypothetical protein